MNYIISTNRFEKSLFSYFVISCYMFISLTLFRILMSFLRLYIHIFICSVGLLLFFINIIFLSFYLCPSIFWVSQAPCNCKQHFILELVLSVVSVVSHVIVVSLSYSKCWLNVCFCISCPIAGNFWFSLHKPQFFW